MVSVEDSHSSFTRFPLPGSFPSLSGKIRRCAGRSMRTICSNLYQDDSICFSLPSRFEFVSENLTDSVVDVRLRELAARFNQPPQSVPSEEEFLELSRTFSDFSAYSRDSFGELQRIASLPWLENEHDRDVMKQVPEPEPCLGFLGRENFSTEIIESISPEDLLPTVKICIEGLQSTSIAMKRSAATKLQLPAKNCTGNRALIGESSAIPALIPLL